MTRASDEAWKKKNTIIFSVRLQKATDADLIAYLEGKESRQGEIKRLMRLAIAAEKGEQ